MKILTTKKHYKNKLGENYETNTYKFEASLIENSTNQNQIKDIQENVVSLTPKINYQEDKNFLENIQSAIQDVSDNQIKSAELTRILNLE